MKRWRCDAYTKELVRKRIRTEYDRIKRAETMNDLDYYYGRATGQLGAIFVIAESITCGIYETYTDFFMRLYIKKKNEIEGR